MVAIRMGWSDLLPRKFEAHKVETAYIRLVIDIKIVHHFN